MYIFKYYTIIGVLLFYLSFRSSADRITRTVPIKNEKEPEDQHQTIQTQSDFERKYFEGNNNSIYDRLLFGKLLFDDHKKKNGIEINHQLQNDTYYAKLLLCKRLFDANKNMTEMNHQLQTFLSKKDKKHNEISQTG